MKSHPATQAFSVLPNYHIFWSRPLCIMHVPYITVASRIFSSIHLFLPPLIYTFCSHLFLRRPPAPNSSCQIQLLIHSELSRRRLRQVWLSARRRLRRRLRYGFINGVVVGDSVMRSLSRTELAVSAPRLVCNKKAAKICIRVGGGLCLWRHQTWLMPRRVISKIYVGQRLLFFFRFTRMAATRARAWVCFCGRA